MSAPLLALAVLVCLFVRPESTLPEVRSGSTRIDARGSGLVRLGSTRLGVTSDPDAVAQSPPKGGPSPGRGGAAPGWSKVLKLSDGRTFITDGGMTIDVAFVKPSVLPGTVLGPASAKIIEGHLAAPLPDEWSLSQLRSGPERKYFTPSGIMLNADYIDYLRRIVPPARVRIRSKTDLDPAVIVLDGKPIGLVMPMRSVHDPQ